MMQRRILLMTLLPRRSLQALLVVTSGVVAYMLNSPQESSLSYRLFKWKSAGREDGRNSRPRRIDDPILEFSKLLRGKSSRTDLLSIISRIPAAKMPEALGLLKEEMAAASLSDQDPSNWVQAAALNEIISALYFHWAEMDPQAALADAQTIASDQRRSIALTGVLTAWMKIDPDAAYRSVKDDQKAGYLARDMFVKLWSPENAFENADRYPDKRGDLLGWYAIGNIDNIERRDSLLEELRARKDLKERSWVYSLLYRAWGYKDFDEAITAAGKEKIPWLEKQLLNDNLGGLSSPKVLQWASAHDRLPSGPQWEKGYGTWLAMNPDEACKWFATETSKWEQAGRSDITAGFLAVDVFGVSGEEIPSNPTRETAAKDALTVHWQRWRAKDTKAADRWLETAPPEIIKLLKK